jgi:hypothetical protein
LGIAISIHHYLAIVTCHFRVQIPWLVPLPRHFPFTKNKHSSLNYPQTTDYQRENQYGTQRLTKTNVKMIFKYLIAFTGLFGFVCTASLDIRAENGVGLESRQIGPQTVTNPPVCDYFKTSTKFLAMDMIKEANVLF